LFCPPKQASQLSLQGLSNLERQMSQEYISFNSTGKFPPHKYSIEKYNCASDIVNYEKTNGNPGKILIIFGNINDKDSLVLAYSESKRQFYKSLSSISQIINSIEIIE